MNLFPLVTLLIMWFLFTLLLVCSIIGIFFLIPVQNNTGYYMSMSDDRRSTWMLIGLKLTRKFIEKI